VGFSGPFVSIAVSRDMTPCNLAGIDVVHIALLHSGSSRFLRNVSSIYLTARRSHPVRWSSHTVPWWLQISHDFGRLWLLLDIRGCKNKLRIGFKSGLEIPHRSLHGVRLSNASVRHMSCVSRTLLLTAYSWAVTHFSVLYFHGL
jgi:hypothetical protein